MANATQTSKATKPAAKPAAKAAKPATGNAFVPGVPRGLVYNGPMACGTVVQVYSTQRRQYVVCKAGKAQGYFTASQTHGHSNAVNRMHSTLLAALKLHSMGSTLGKQNAAKLAQYLVPGAAH